MSGSRLGQSATGSLAAAAFLAVAALLASTAGCTKPPGQGESARSSAPTAAASQPFLQKIPDAPTTVAYSGERHVRLSFVVAGTPKTLEYDETVHSDGRGNFSIVPGKVTSPEMSADEAEFFSILQERRDGFFFHYRDFRIRDWNAFLRNWSAKDLGSRERVADRECAVLEFRRSHGPEDLETGSVESWGGASGGAESGDAHAGGGHYKAWIDTANGLVLRAEEFDAGGAKVGLVEFETLTLAPDLSNVALHGDRSSPKPLDVASDTSEALGFRLLRPKILPDGYRLERAESVTADGQSSTAQSGADRPDSTRSGAAPAGPTWSESSGRWARLAYGDGVDEIFFLQSIAPEAAASAFTSEVDVGSRFIRGFRIGPWTVLQGQFDRTVAIVMGKTDAASLERMLKSAVR